MEKRDPQIFNGQGRAILKLMIEERETKTSELWDGRVGDPAAEPMGRDSTGNVECVIPFDDANRKL